MCEDVAEENAEEEEEGGVDEPPVEEVTMATNGNTNFPAIWSEEGKYLASVLGDALVKGLSRVSQERPQDPVEYLSNFLRTYKDGEEGEEGGIDEATAAAVAMAAVGGGAAAMASGGAGEEAPAEEESVVAGENGGDEEMQEGEGDVNGEDGGDNAGEENANDTTDAAEAEPEAADAAEAEEAPMEEEAAPEPEEEAAPPEEAEAPPPPAEEETIVAESTTVTESEGAAPEESPEQPNTEDALNTDLEQGYDALEDALDEQETSSSSPFDPVKEEQAEATLLSSKITEPGEDGDVNAFSGRNSTRDESGQSVLHFACTRPGGGSTIMAFLQNPSVNLAWRDVGMRTARDVAYNLGRNENVRVVDNYIVLLAQRGDVEAVEGLMVDGYEHLADVEDLQGMHVVEVADNADHKDVAQLIRSAPEFRERVERVHRCVRSGDIDGVKSLVGQDKRVGYAMNPRTGRNALHVAVLCEEIGIVKWLADNCVEAVKRGDNLERTCLHLSMGVDKCEKIVRILVRAGAKRVVKDLRDRQPSYYYVHKHEIGELQAEERAIVN